jgi:hypothetical protein
VLQRVQAYASAQKFDLVVADAIYFSSAVELRQPWSPPINQPARPPARRSLRPRTEASVTPRS